MVRACQNERRQIRPALRDEAGGHRRFTVARRRRIHVEPVEQDQLFDGVRLDEPLDDADEPCGEAAVPGEEIAAAGTI